MMLALLPVLVDQTGERYHVYWNPLTGPLGFIGAAVLLHELTATLRAGRVNPIRQSPRPDRARFHFYWSVVLQTLGFFASLAFSYGWYASDIGYFLIFGGLMAISLIVGMFVFVSPNPIHWLRKKNRRPGR